MELESLTATNFKSQFSRDFPYLSSWSATKSYNIDDEVLYSDVIYRAVLASKNKNPSTQTSYWIEISASESNYINDFDIERAFQDAQITFNQSLFSTDAKITIGYMYLTAHYLVMNIKAALGGIRGSAEFSAASKSAGSVSESLNVPEWVTKDRTLSFFAQSAYGMRYLSLISGQLVGNIEVVQGETLA